MAVADLVAEWFETDLLQASVAARGDPRHRDGALVRGHGAVLLLGAAIDPVPGGSSVSAVGGPGAVTRAMAEAAREAGAEIRTGADVQRILVKDGVVTGVVLADGTEIAAATVVSGADPRRTLLRLIDPVELEPDFMTRIRNYRCPGTVAKLNFGLRGLPAFRGVAAIPRRRSAGASTSDRASTISSARSTRRSTARSPPAPYLDVAFPSVPIRRWRPRAGTSCRCTCSTRPSRCATDRGTGEADALADLVLRTLETLRARA